MWLQTGATLGVTREKQQLVGQNRTPKRSYFDDVVVRIEQLRERFDVEQYGLNWTTPVKVGRKYPLFLRKKAKNGRDDLPNILVTGGVPWL